MPTTGSASSSACVSLLQRKSGLRYRSIHRRTPKPKTFNGPKISQKNIYFKNATLISLSKLFLSTVEELMKPKFIKSPHHVDRTSHDQKGLFIVSIYNYHHLQYLTSYRTHLKPYIIYRILTWRGDGPRDGAPSTRAGPPRPWSCTACLREKKNINIRSTTKKHHGYRNPHPETNHSLLDLLW